MISLSVISDHMFYDGPRVRVISPVEKEKVYGEKDLLKSHVLSSE